LLTRGLVDGEYLGSRSALVTDSEGTRGVENLKAIGKVNEFQEIAINGLGENGLHDGLPARDNRKVHRGFHVRVARRLELLPLVADEVAEAFNLVADELIMQVNSFGQCLVLIKPEATP